VQQALAFLKEQHRLAQANRAEYDEALGLDGTDNANTAAEAKTMG